MRRDSRAHTVCANFNSTPEMTKFAVITEKQMETYIKHSFRKQLKSDCFGGVVVGGFRNRVYVKPLNILKYNIVTYTIQTNMLQFCIVDEYNLNHTNVPEET